MLGFIIVFINIYYKIYKYSPKQLYLITMQFRLLIVSKTKNWSQRIGTTKYKVKEGLEMYQLDKEFHNRTPFIWTNNCKGYLLCRY